VEISRAVDLLGALAQDTRLAVFRHLVGAGPEGVTAGALAERLGVPSPTLSFHLKELSRVELVVGRAEGRFVRYSANFEAMNRLLEYLVAHCCDGEGGCLPAAPTRAKPRRAAART